MSIDDEDQLQPGDTLDDGDLEDVLDRGYSPPDRPPKGYEDYPTEARAPGGVARRAAGRGGARRRSLCRGRPGRVPEDGTRSTSSSASTRPATAPAAWCARPGMESGVDKQELAGVGIDGAGASAEEPACTSPASPSRRKTTTTRAATPSPSGSGRRSRSAYPSSSGSWQRRGGVTRSSSAAGGCRSGLGAARGLRRLERLVAVALRPPRDGAAAGRGDDVAHRGGALPAVPEPVVRRPAGAAPRNRLLVPSLWPSWRCRSRRSSVWWAPCARKSDSSASASARTHDAYARRVRAGCEPGRSPVPGEAADRRCRLGSEADGCVLWKEAITPDTHPRTMLPIPDRPAPRLTTYDAKDPDTRYRHRG